ncbi:MAG TPA: hypothetical protein VGQ75_10215 [Thermoanaerobaculia bacterium]|nr:hypothetical protein [Thermoanaerobaculia bacterium]HEV8608834.1 hypothetical protein [Thermoanaerobaculia bacterium]
MLTLLVAIATFFVLAATLGAVVGYTRAAFQQAEGLVKPCLTPDFEPVRIEPPSGTEYDAVFPLQMSGGTLLLRNIGIGPAVNVRYKLAKLDGVELPRMEDAAPATPVGPGRAFDTTFPQNKLWDATRFRIHYDSLTGKRYESVGVILDKKLVDHLNFRRVKQERTGKARRSS